jgi:hypothetical protein
MFINICFFIIHKYYILTHSREEIIGLMYSEVKTYQLQFQKVIHIFKYYCVVSLLWLRKKELTLLLILT